MLHVSLSLLKLLTNVKKTVVIDGLEGQRAFVVHEMNFRNILKEHIKKLMEAKRIIWQSRAKIRWAKLGDENTKFFHAVATPNYRRNYIYSIKIDDDVCVTNHEQKAAFIWISIRID